MNLKVIEFEFVFPVVFERYYLQWLLQMPL